MFPSHWEILVIFLVVLLLFGARRIPEMAQGLGKGIRALVRGWATVWGRRTRVFPALSR